MYVLKNFTLDRFDKWNRVYEKLLSNIPHIYITLKYALWVASVFVWRELSKLVPNGTMVEDTLAQRHTEIAYKD